MLLFVCALPSILFVQGLSFIDNTTETKSITLGSKDGKPDYDIEIVRKNGEPMT
jgi:hypothetical protein